MKRQNLHKKGKSDDSGFSIMEAMIALLVFTIASLAAISMQAKSISSSSHARNLTEAASTAAEEVEILGLLDYISDLDLSAGDHDNVPIENTRYTLSYTVTDDSLLKYTKLLQVTVQWMENNQVRTMSLDYVKADII